MKIRTIPAFQKLFTLVLIFTLIQTGFAQATAPKTAEETEAEFKKEVTVFLRETASEVGSLRSPENRIGFTAELAGLMWFSDEKESRAMYLSVISDFRHLVGQYDAQLNMIESAPGDGGDYAGGGFLFGGDDSEKGKLGRKLRMAMTVRQEVADSMAEHDPQMAFDFFYDSLSAITNADRRKEYEAQDKYLETKLLNEIAEHNAAKAAELGRKSLANGTVNAQHLDLLKKIYEKDADKGAEFGDDITRRLKDTSGGPEETVYIVGAALRTGISNFESVKKEGGKKPMFSERNLRDLSELLAQRLLETPAENDPFSAMYYVDVIEKFAPSRAVQIRAKFGKAGTGDGTGMGDGRGNGPVATVAPPPSSYSANSNLNVSGRGSTGTGSNSARLEKDAAAAELKRKAEEQLMKDVESLGARQLPKEERDKIVAQARKIVSEMGGKDQKIMALSMLAAQVAKAGDKELAGEIMRDAGAMVNPQPKNYKDFLLVWMLASGYAEADPDKAFPLLDDAINRLNDTITGVVRIAEFLDVAGEIVDDGEVQVGAFGGSMIREITRGLGVVDGTLRSLAKADLVKTKALTNRFDRPEVRVLAKMLVLRAVMGNKPAPGEDESAGPGVLDSN
jgi:carbon monoxide dehydrogenase subunit G